MLIGQQPAKISPVINEEDATCGNNLNDRALQNEEDVTSGAELDIEEDIRKLQKEIIRNLIGSGSEDEFKKGEHPSKEGNIDEEGIYEIRVGRAR